MESDKRRCFNDSYKDATMIVSSSAGVSQITYSEVMAENWLIEYLRDQEKRMRLSMIFKVN